MFVYASTYLLYWKIIKTYYNMEIFSLIYYYYAVFIYMHVDMCGVEGNHRTLWSKRHEFEPSSRHKIYMLYAVGQ